MKKFTIIALLLFNFGASIAFGKDVPITGMRLIMLYSGIVNNSQNLKKNEMSKQELTSFIIFALAKEYQSFATIKTSSEFSAENKNEYITIRLEMLNQYIEKNFPHTIKEIFGSDRLNLLLIQKAYNYVLAWENLKSDKPFGVDSDLLFIALNKKTIYWISRSFDPQSDNGGKAKWQEKPYSAVNRPSREFRFSDDLVLEVFF